MQIYTMRMHTTEALIPVLRLLKRAEVDGVGVGGGGGGGGGGGHLDPLLRSVHMRGIFLCN